MDEAPWPELAVPLEEGTVDGEAMLFGNVQSVLNPRTVGRRESTSARRTR